MGVKIAAELEDEVEGEFGPAGEGGQAGDVREELGHGGGEVSGANGGVEVVLEAVQVEVYDCDFAVELGVKGGGGAGGLVHERCDGWWDVCHT